MEGLPSLPTPLRPAFWRTDRGEGWSRVGWGGVGWKKKQNLLQRRSLDTWWGKGGGREGGDDHLPKTNNKQINDANRN